jgi:hypothetical protein
MKVIFIDLGTNYKISEEGVIQVKVLTCMAACCHSASLKEILGGSATEQYLSAPIEDRGEDPAMAVPFTRVTDAA